MQIVLVEDEPMVARRLRRFVSECTQNKATIRQFSNLDDAQDSLASQPADILFLDLNLHGKDGFTLLNEQLAQPFHTIVVSANTDRALEAFELGVLDFVGKPFTQERIEKALKRYTDKNYKGQCKQLSYKKQNSVHFININDIQFVQAAGHYSEITMQNGDVILHDKHLDKVMQILPNTFVRVHRSYAISLHEVSNVSQKSGAKYLAHLKSGASVPVGRTKFSELITQLENLSST